MMSRSIHFRRSLVPVLCLGLGGCIGPSERHASTPDRPPAMPTILPAATAGNAVPENEILATAARAARDNDIDGVLRALRSVGDPARRSHLAGELMTQLQASDPKLRARLALALGTELGQMAVIEDTARNLAQQDQEFALRWAAELPASPASRRMTGAVVDEMVAANPAAAFDRIGRLPAGAVRDDMLVLAAGAWARRDPDAAISWLRERPSDDLKQRLTLGIGFEVAQVRPERAIAVAEMLPEGRNRWLMFSAIAQTWIAVDSKAALAWAGKLPTGEPRDAALAGIDTGYGVPIYRRSGGAPGTRGGSSRTRGGGGAAVASSGEINTPAFAAWLASQPRGMSREEAILEYIRQRGALDPAGVAPLIESLPSGYTKDRAKDIYLDGLLIGSPTEATRWVRSLPRSERSDELVEKTARRLMLTNPAAAVEWIDQSTLPTYRKEQLLFEARR